MAKHPAFRYEVTKIGEGTYLINEFYSTMFVLVGDTRALVIDCGTGVGDFKGIVESLTDKPYTVVETHAHVDHIGGREQFPVVHVGERDVPFVKGVNLLLRKGYLLLYRFSGISYSGLSVKPVRKEPKIVPVHDGEIFDLGNRTVKAFFSPGHTVGSTSYLDVENRTVFIGDIANENLLMYLPHATTIDTMIQTMEALLSRTDYDTVWSSHHTAPQTREDIKTYLAGAKKVSQQKNTLLPLVKKQVYKGAILMYRSSNIHEK